MKAQLIVLPSAPDLILTPVSPQRFKEFVVVVVDDMRKQLSPA